MIDLRSDTVTKPTPEMREEICRAKVGDDVYEEDPTVNELEEKVSGIFGREKSLFVPSGSMGNQISVKVHTQPGSEVILDSECHIFNFEMATISNFSGAMPRPIYTEEKYLPIEEVEKSIRPKKYNVPQTELITVENTHNKKGGVIYPLDKSEELVCLAKEEDIPLHLDASRIFNAAVATGTSVEKFSRGFDSIMFCLSKGLGAPIGSMLVGDGSFIDRARVIRKQLGGGMRQVGLLAAAGIYALDHHVERLSEDHKNAKILFRGLKQFEVVRVESPETNIVNIHLDKKGGDAFEIQKMAKKRDLLIGSRSDEKIRLVTHLDVDEEDVKETIEIFEDILQ